MNIVEAKVTGFNLIATGQENPVLEPETIRSIEAIITSLEGKGYKQFKDRILKFHEHIKKVDAHGALTGNKIYRYILDAIYCVWVDRGNDADYNKFLDKVFNKVQLALDENDDEKKAVSTELFCKLMEEHNNTIAYHDKLFENSGNAAIEFAGRSERWFSESFMADITKLQVVLNNKFGRYFIQRATDLALERAMEGHMGMCERNTFEGLSYTATYNTDIIPFKGTYAVNCKRGLTTDAFLHRFHTRWFYVYKSQDAVCDELCKSYSDFKHILQIQNRKQVYMDILEERVLGEVFNCYVDFTTDSDGNLVVEFIAGAFKDKLVIDMQDMFGFVVIIVLTDKTITAYALKGGERYEIGTKGLAIKNKRIYKEVYGPIDKTVHTEAGDYRTQIISFSDGTSVSYFNTIPTAEELNGLLVSCISEEKRMEYERT